MQRLTGAALAATLVLGGLAPTSAMTGRHSSLGRGTASATAPLGFVATHTQAMKLSNAIDVGSVNPAMPMVIVVGLTANKAAAEAELHHIYTKGDPQFHRFLTPQQFTAAFAPSAASVTAVESYLSSEGFKGISASPNRMTVRAQGSATQVERAFATSIHNFSQNGKAVFANTTAANVPAALSDKVLAVLGLQNAPMIIPIQAPKAAVQTAILKIANARLAANHGRLTTASQPCDGLQFIPAVGPPSSLGIPLPAFPPLPVGPCPGKGYYTNDFEGAYDDQGDPTASHTVVAEFSEGNQAPLVSDLRLNEYVNGLRQVPVTIVPVDLQSPDTYGAGEWEMDTQVETGVAGDVKALYDYNVGSLIDNDITLAFNRWVTDDIAPIANASFGECEYESEIDASMALDDQILLEGLLQGQTLFASSGDTGSACPNNALGNGDGPVGIPDVSYPASSPYAEGAGGTSLFTGYTSDQYFGEIGWNSGGGGISLFESAEFWQNPENPINCPPEYCSLRTIVAGRRNPERGTHRSGQRDGCRCGRLRMHLLPRRRPHGKCRHELGRAPLGRRLQPPG